MFIHLYNFFDRLKWAKSSYFTLTCWVTWHVRQELDSHKWANIYSISNRSWKVNSLTCCQVWWKWLVHWQLQHCSQALRCPDQSTPSRFCYTHCQLAKSQLRLSSLQRSILSLFLWLHLSTFPNFYLSERFLAPYVQTLLHILCLKAAIHCCRGWTRWMMATSLQRFGYRLKHQRIKPCPQNIFLFTIFIPWQIQIFKVE